MALKLSPTDLVCYQPHVSRPDIPRRRHTNLYDTVTPSYLNWLDTTFLSSLIAFRTNSAISQRRSLFTTTAVTTNPPNHPPPRHAP